MSDLLVNGSQLTRLYSLEEGLGYGRIRLSVLFRPVEAKLPATLIGFDTGTLEVRDLSVNIDQSMSLDLSKCEVRLKTTKSGGDEKVSRKNAQKQEDGSVVWASEEDNLTRIPVRVRYSSALLMSFKDASTAASLGVKRAGRKALAVLWLRDIADNDDATVEVPLWTATDGDYSRLKMNYSPPDGNLDAWDDDKKKLRRVGTVRVHLRFAPGISELHRKLLDGGGSHAKEAWEAFTRERDGGLRDTIGESAGDDERNPERRPEDLAEKRRGSEESEQSQEPRFEGKPASQEEQKKNPEEHQDGAASDRPSMDGNKIDGESAEHAPAVNTMVSSEAVENESIEHRSSSAYGDVDNGSEDSDGDETDGEKKGVVGKLKKWREHEKELHKQHRGIMQVKPARTAEWIKDNMEEGVHHMKDRFTMKSRKPGVETEV